MPVIRAIDIVDMMATDTEDVQTMAKYPGHGSADYE